MNARRVFIKSLGVIGAFFSVPFFAQVRKNCGYFKTIAFLKVPTKYKNFSKIEDLLINSASSYYWKAFRVTKSKFLKEGRLLQTDKVALGNNLFSIPTHYKTKQDYLSFMNQINIKLLEKELSKINVHFHVKIIG